MSPLQGSAEVASLRLQLDEERRQRLEERRQRLDERRRRLAAEEDASRLRRRLAAITGEVGSGATAASSGASVSVVAGTSRGSGGSPEAGRLDEVEPELSPATEALLDAVLASTDEIGVDVDVIEDFVPSGLLVYFFLEIINSKCDWESCLTALRSATN